MKFPLVSRDRYDEALAREQRREERIRELEAKLFELVDEIVGLKVMTPEEKAVERFKESSFALPAVVQEAILQRTTPGSKNEGLLRKHAETRLSNPGDVDPEEVAREILAGSSAFTNTDEGW